MLYHCFCTEVGMDLCEISKSSIYSFAISKNVFKIRSRSCYASTTREIDYRDNTWAKEILGVLASRIEEQVDRLGPLHD